MDRARDVRKLFAWKFETEKAFWRLLFFRSGIMKTLEHSHPFITSNIGSGYCLDSSTYESMLFLIIILKGFSSRLLNKIPSDCPIDNARPELAGYRMKCQCLKFIYYILHIYIH